MTPPDIQVPLVLRDIVGSLLRPDQAVTAAQLADRIHTGGQHGIRQIYRCLQQLEERGLARRQPSSPISWTTTT